MAKILAWGAPDAQGRAEFAEGAETLSHAESAEGAEFLFARSPRRARSFFSRGVRGERGVFILACPSVAEGLARRSDSRCAQCHSAARLVRS